MTEYGELMASVLTETTIPGWSHAQASGNLTAGSTLAIFFEKERHVKWGLLALVLWVFPAHAASFDPDKAEGNIFDSCLRIEEKNFQPEDYQLVLEVGVCRGFVLGWLQARATGHHRYCPPPAGRLYDYIQIFNTYVKKNPVWRTRAPGNALEAALADVYPCTPSAGDKAKGDARR